MKLNTSRRPKI